MKKKTFSREQLSKSRTFGYSKDLVMALLEKPFWRRIRLRGKCRTAVLPVRKNISI